MSARTSSGRRTSLAERRRRARRRLTIALAIIGIILLGLTLYGIQKPGVRVSHIQAYGTELPLEAIALEVMQGKYLGIIPRDSIFFYPEQAIRARIIERHGDIAGVSFFRKGTNGLTLRITERVPIARWCPAPVRTAETVSTSSPQASTSNGSELDNCWFFDDSGLLFATSSEVAVVYPFIIYEPLSLPESIRGQRLPHAGLLPASLNFARQLDTFGADATSISIEAPEATIALKGGARINYILGKENEAYTALVSAKNQLALTSSELDYVDLRFSGKVYVKKKGDSVAE